MPVFCYYFPSCCRSVTVDPTDPTAIMCANMSGEPVAGGPPEPPAVPTALPGAPLAPGLHLLLAPHQVPVVPEPQPTPVVIELDAIDIANIIEGLQPTRGDLIDRRSRMAPIAGQWPSHATAAVTDSASSSWVNVNESQMTMESSVDSVATVEAVPGESSAHMWAKGPWNASQQTKAKSAQPVSCKKSSLIECIRVPRHVHIL